MTKLGVNIDHVATLRQARREFDPDPIAAAKLCEQAGCDSIVCHLREDRRHINETDVWYLRESVETSLTLELSLDKKIVSIASSVKPDHAMFVPERREEITTEGGLDVIKFHRRIQEAIKILKKKNIVISLFVDPKKDQLKRAKDLGADIVELHTGPYANASTKKRMDDQLKKLKSMAQFGSQLGLSISAGHGLKYHNAASIAKIKEIQELNIGHSIISYAVFVGLKQAVKEMKRIINP